VQRVSSLLTWAFSAGVVVVHAMPVLVPLRRDGAALLCIGLAVAGGLSLWAMRRRPLRAAVLAALLGAAYAGVVAGAHLGSRLSAAEHRSVLRLEGRIDGLLDDRASVCRFAFVTVRVNGSARRLRLRTNWPDRNCSELQPGQWLVLAARAYQPRGLANPGGFDYEGWLFRQRFDGSAWVDTRQLQPETGAVAGIDAWVDRARVDAAGRLVHALPATVADTAAMLKTLTLGMRAELDPQLRATLTATGTSHLFAISGLHVGMLAGWVLALARYLAPGLRSPGAASSRRRGAASGAPRAAGIASRWPTLIAFGAAVMYAALAGFSVPTRRALITLLMLFGADLSRRHCSLPNVLGMALALVLLVDPMAALAPGFWLSFVAVGSIALALRQRDRGRGRLTVLMSMARVQVAVWVGLIPLGVLFFGQASLLSPLVNALAIPYFATLVLPLSLIGLLASQLAGWLAWGPLWLAGHTLAWLIDALEIAAALPATAIALHRPGPLLLLGELGVLMLLVRGLPGRPIGVLLCLPMLLWRAPVPDEGAMELVLLDVGQGLGVVVRTRRHTLLYDAGPRYRSGSSTGSIVVVPYLLRAGVRQLDRIVISHADNDHRGGLADVLARYPDAPVAIGGGASGYAACRDGERWQWDGVRFEFLHPPDQSWAGNDGSCVLRIDIGQGEDARTVLLTGDVERRAEGRLVARHRSRLDVDVVVAPHHGSDTSSSADFVRAASPSVVLFATGYANRWGFPSPRVRDRWVNAGAGVNDTAADGALTLSLSAGEPIIVRGERAARRRYWMLN
jgi:competence protein ComEC